MHGSRSVASGLSLLLVGLQFLGLAHLALQRHGVCWEHGTLTELQTSRVAASNVETGAQPGLHSGSAAARLDDVDGHHHCPVQASRRDWGAPEAGAALVLALGEGPFDVAVGTSSPRADDGLLRRAPKQSPPLTA
jgi:hypothetical protein